MVRVVSYIMILGRGVKIGDDGGALVSMASRAVCLVADGGAAFLVGEGR